MSITISSEAIVGAITTIGAVIVGLNKLKWITFGKPIPPPDRRKCPQEILDAFNHECKDHRNVIETIKQHDANSRRREEKIDRIISTLEDITKSVASVEGYLQGRNGYHR